MSLILGDILEVKAACYRGNQLGLMVSHWLVTALTGTDPFEPAQIARRLSDLMHVEIKGLMDDDAKYLGHSARVIKGVPTAEEYSIVNQGYGVVTGDALPQQICGLISLRTGLPGRTNRGRQYVPFPAEGDNPNTTIPGVTYQTALSTLGAIYTLPQTATILGSSITVRCVITNKTGTGGNQPVTGALARNKWATQRRRGGFGKPNEVPFGDFP